MGDEAITDALLAIVAGREGFRLLSRPHGGTTAGVGLFLVAVAATFGVFRYSVAPDLVGSHEGVSRLAAQVGMPLVGVGYLVAAFAPTRDRVVRPYAFVVLLLLAVLLPVYLVDVVPYGAVVGGSGMAAVIVGSVALARVTRAALIGAAGAAGVLISGLVIVGEGELGFFSRLAWFHVGLAASAWLLARGLLRLPEDHGLPDRQ